MDQRTHIYVPQSGLDPRELAGKGERVWAPSPFGQHLFISNLGEVARRRHLEDEHAGPALTTNPKTGYVTIHVPGHGRLYMHHLVLAAFEGTRPGYRVLRTNSTRSDNRLSNLRWSDRPQLSRDTRAQIRAMLAAGLPQATVARQLGMTPSHVHYYANAVRRDGEGT